MLIGDRLRELREEKKLSQGDIEKRTGLRGCYVSRVENGHTVPTIETLQKLALAFEIPLYQLFYHGERPPRLPNLLKWNTADASDRRSPRGDSVYLHKLIKCLSKASSSDRKLLLLLAQRVATARGRSKAA